MATHASHVWWTDLLDAVKNNNPFVIPGEGNVQNR